MNFQALQCQVLQRQRQVLQHALFPKFLPKISSQNFFPKFLPKISSQNWRLLVV
jgi:hypothetical protein